MNTSYAKSFFLSVTLLFLSINGYSQGGAVAIPSTELALCSQASHSASPFVEDNSVCGASGNRFGASLVIGRNDRIIYEESIGSASADGARKVLDNNLFRLASIHKPITAIAVMKLIEDGLLSLSDQVFGSGGIIDDPEVLAEIHQGSLVTSITVDHLLRQTSGWAKNLALVPFSLPASDYPDALNGIAFEFGEQNRANLNTMVKYMARQSPVVTPGDFFWYNNMNYVILNKVIEKISGVRYEDYLKTAVFDPLNISEIKPAKTFLADKYQDEVEYIWPSLTEPSNQHPSYCTNSDVASQYGHFRHEGTWIGSARAVTKLFMAIDKSSSIKILSDASIDQMFNTVSIPTQGGGSNRNVARGWVDTALTSSGVDSNQGDWAFSGGVAGSGSFFAKSDGNFITYLRNVRKTEQEPNNTTLWDMFTVISSAQSELGNMSPSVLNSKPHISRYEWNGEWKPSTVSEADVQAGCHSYRVSSFLFN